MNANPDTPSWWRDHTPSPPLQLPGLPPETSSAVCVIGLGGAGLTALSVLQQHGIAAIGIDRANELGAGAAGRNGGFLLAGMSQFHHHAVARFGRDLAVSKYLDSLAALESLAAQHPDLISRTGSVRMAVDEAEWRDCEAQLDAMRADGLPVQIWRDGAQRGLLFPLDAAFDPLALCVRQANALRANGVQLFGAAEVTSIEPTRVQTSKGLIHAHAVLVCVDGGLERLLPKLAGVRSARLQMCASAPDARVRIPRPVYAREGYDYWQQRMDGSIVVGGGRDLNLDAEWDQLSGTSATIQAHLEHLLRTVIGSNAPITHRWSAPVAFTASGLPLCERIATGEHQGVWVCGAYNGTGNLWSRKLGGEIAHAICKSLH